MPTKTQIAGGHKANMTTLIPLKSAKQHSHEVLDSGDFSSAGKDDAAMKLNNVASGLNATINNRNNSEEAKQSARGRLEGL